VRAIPLIRATLVLLAGLAGASGAWAGGPAAGESAKKPSTNSFTLVYAATPREQATAPSMGVGVPTRPVVSNPYNVPLLRNAGSFGASR
jgi:hypothetical protein